MFAVLTAVLAADWERKVIPGLLLWAAVFPSVLSVWVFPEIGLISRAAGAVSISTFLLVLTLLVPGAFGGGDIKLMVVLGFFLGWKKCVLAFVLAVFGAGMYTLFFLLRGKIGRRDEIAFGPFLCMGAAVSIVLGERILEWYMGIL